MEAFYVKEQGEGTQIKKAFLSFLAILLLSVRGDANYW